MREVLPEIMACVAVLIWMTALCVVDVRVRRLPNVLTLPGAVAILACSVWGGRGSAALAGAAMLAGGYLVVHLIAPAAMGAGDVKLALGLGALAGAFGMEIWALAALGAPLLTAVVGLACRLRTVPHGPSMCVATALAAAPAVWAR